MISLLSLFEFRRYADGGHRETADIMPLLQLPMGQSTPAIARAACRWAIAETGGGLDAPL